MQQYIQRVRPVNATQWFKEGDHPAVQSHEYCGHRQCLVCDGENKTYFFIPSAGSVAGIFWVNPGDWIVENHTGIIDVLNPDTFIKLYQPHTL